jgi:hypothetical protein
VTDGVRIHRGIETGEGLGEGRARADALSFAVLPLNAAQGGRWRGRERARERQVY